MPPTTWSSEIREFRDPLTGRTIRQLTSAGNNVHLYFTENAFNRGKSEIIFRSDRASGQDHAPHEGPHYNLFRMDLESGEAVQLTDEPHPVDRVTKTPDGSLIVYSSGPHLKALDTETGEVSIIYEETGRFTLGQPSIAPNRRYVVFTRNEKVEHPEGPNYRGFAERYYRVKDGRVTLAYLDGSGAFDVFRDTHQLAHAQVCPVNGTLVMVCHEGPWHLVTQRIWLLDLVSREVRPCVRQDASDSIGHEFWTQDGFIFFDNRGPGFDGTITSSRTQAVAQSPQERTFTPYVGFADRRGNLLRRINLPHHCNHYHTNPNGTALVGDDVDEVVLIDLSNGEAEVRPLCRHGTSWHTQASHPHPTWSWDGKRILYASDAGGQVNLYLLEP